MRRRECYESVSRLSCEGSGRVSAGSTELCGFGGYCAAKFLVRALLKAHATDTEKVIAALKGLSIETPVETITMRACDHQAMAPLVWGTLGEADGSRDPIAYIQ